MYSLPFICLVLWICFNKWPKRLSFPIIKIDTSGSGPDIFEGVNGCPEDGFSIDGG
jgi:hypothetical protein